MVRVAWGLLIFSALSWAQDPPPKYRGRTAEEWVERLSQGDEDAKQAVRQIGAPCVRLILARLDSQGEDGSLEAALEEMLGQAAPTLLEETKQGKTGIRLLALHFLLLGPKNIPAEFVTEFKELVPSLLADKDREFRMGAALRLCGKGFRDVSALPPLLEALQDQELRAWAASLLWCFPQEGVRVVPPLVESSRAADREVRHFAFVSLWAFWNSPAARARILEAGESKDAGERLDAVPPFELVPGSPDDIAFCLKMAADTDDAVRKKACEALEYAWTHVKLGQNADAALSHPRPEVRELACRTVAAGETTALARVFERLGDEDEDDEVRLAALDAIARIGDAGPDVRKRLRELLVGPRSESGQRAAWTLIVLDVEVEAAAAFLVEGWKGLEVATVLGPRAKAAIPALQEMLDSVPLEAAPALYAVTGEVEAPLQALGAVLKREDAFERLRACRVLARFGPAAAPLVPQLAKLLADEDSDVRRFAAIALGYVGAASKPAIPKLIELLDEGGDPETGVGTHAAAALAWLDVDTSKGKDLLAAVLAARDPNDGNVRPGALRYAWKHGTLPVEEVVERCRKSLGPPNWEDVPPILRLLGEIGPPAEAALPDLEQLTRARLCQYEIRAAAADAIRRIRPPG